MNPVIENIMTRRSVRSYDSIEIAKDALQTIIDAGNMAPSGCNAQGWRFAVVTDKAFRKRLSEIALPRYKKWMEESKLKKSLIFLPMTEESNSRSSIFPSSPCLSSAKHV
jgi:nitroreductase